MQERPCWPRAVRAGTLSAILGAAAAAACGGSVTEDPGGPPAGTGTASAGGAGGAGGAATSTSAGGGGGATGDCSIPGPEALEQFGDCMTYSDWIETQIPLATNQESTFNGQQVPCYDCHASGVGDNFMPDPNQIDDVKQAFQSMRHLTPILNLARWTTDTNGCFVSIVPSYRWRDKGTEGGPHPAYMMLDEYVIYYEDWFGRTHAKWSEAQATGIACDPAAGDPPP